MTAYFAEYGRDISLATNDYDATYGESLGSLNVRQCIVCAALVAWHESLTREGSSNPVGS